ncbi:MAG: tetratricopeptide repeat protein, partial [Moorea sp. SIO4G2]|nr:tetratricopeptide repeat protein [Moorena sp. SIO4G2]
SIAQAIGDRKAAKKAIASLKAAYYSQGNYTKAMEYHQKNLALTNP